VPSRLLLKREYAAGAADPASGKPVLVFTPQGIQQFLPQLGCADTMGPHSHVNGGDAPVAALLDSRNTAWPSLLLRAENQAPFSNETEEAKPSGKMHRILDISEFKYVSSQINTSVPDEGILLNTATAFL